MQICAAVMKSLAIVAIIAFTICTATDAEKVSPCCVAASTSEVKEPIIDFRVQRKNLPCIRAVVFVTAKAQYCIDPTQPWVRKKVEEIISRRSSTTVSPTSVSPRLTSSMPQTSTDSI